MGEEEEESVDLERLCNGISLEQRGAPTQRPYAARRARSGSVMPMLRMNSGIRAC
jgi:hypothetical protein